MANKQQKREYYYRRMRKWKEREPSRWHIFKWLKWKREKPVKPDWLDKWEKQNLNPWEW